MPGDRQGSLHRQGIFPTVAPAGAVATQGGQGGARKALGEAFRAAAAFAAAGPSVLLGLTGEVQGKAHHF